LLCTGGWSSQRSSQGRCALRRRLAGCRLPSLLCPAGRDPETTLQARVRSRRYRRPFRRPHLRGDPRLSEEGGHDTRWRAVRCSPRPSAEGGLVMLRRCAAILAWSLVLIAQAPAQTGPPQTAAPRPYLALKENYQVFVLGDSLAAGLWSGLNRVSNGDARLAIDGRYKEDSGLARPEYYDWNLALPKILKSNRIDIAVVMIGTNDAQEIRDGNLRHVFGTPEWNSLYAAQVDRLIETLKQAGAAVYWVELPPMAAGDYDAETRAISAIQAERAKAAGVKFVATRSTFAAKDGGY